MSATALALARHQQVMPLMPHRLLLDIWTNDRHSLSPPLSNTQTYVYFFALLYTVPLFILKKRAAVISTTNGADFTNLVNVK